MDLMHTLGEKAGPLPVWGWGAIGGITIGIVLLAIKLRSGGSGFTQQQPQSVTLTPNGGSGGVGGTQTSTQVCPDGSVVTDISLCPNTPKHPGPPPTPITPPLTPIARAPIEQAPIQSPVHANPIIPIAPQNPSLFAPSYAQPYVAPPVQQQNPVALAQQQDALLYQQSKASPSPTFSSLGSGTPATQLGASPYIEQLQMNSRVPFSTLLPSTPQQSFEFYNLAPTSNQPVAHQGPGGVITYLLPR